MPGNRLWRNYVQEGVDKVIATVVSIMLAARISWPIAAIKPAVADISTGCIRLSGSNCQGTFSAQRPENLPPLQVCLQVNVSGETTKVVVQRRKHCGLGTRYQPVTKATTARLNGDSRTH